MKIQFTLTISIKLCYVEQCFFCSETQMVDRIVVYVWFNDKLIQYYAGIVSESSIAGVVNTQLIWTMQHLLVGDLEITS